jgi:ubiquinone biosynthesis protein UbiJ
MLPFKPLEKIQELLNAILRQDERALASVSELAGKLIAIQVTGTALTIFVKFEREGMLLSLEHEAEPNVTIKARPFTLIGLLLDRDGKAAGITPDMEISGDTNLAQRFQELLRNVEIDWEEHLSHVIGDIAAHQVGRLFRTTRSYLRDTRLTLGMNISEYLRYEKEILPTREDVEAFVSAVDMLRNDAERLQQRFDRLLRKVT